MALLTAIISIALTAVVTYAAFRYRNRKLVEVDIANRYWKADVTDMTVTVVNTGLIPVTVRSLGICVPVGKQPVLEPKLDWWVRLSRKLHVSWCIRLYGKLLIGRLGLSRRDQLLGAIAEVTMSGAQWQYETLKDGELPRLQQGESETRIISIQVLSIPDRFSREDHAVQLMPFCELVGDKTRKWGNLTFFAKISNGKDQWLHLGGTKGD